MLSAISEQPHHTTAYIGTPGESDTLLSYSRYTTNHFWNKHGKLLPTHNEFKRQSILLYSEYALNAQNSLSINGGYSLVEESLDGNSRGVEDIELGWKYLLLDGCTSALTSQIIAIIPCGEKKTSIRYGKAGIQASLLYSDLFELWDRCGWYDLDLGYRFYSGFPADQIRSSAAVGYNIASCVTLIGTMELEYGVGNGKSEGNRNNIVFHPNYRLLKAKIECVINLFPHVAVTVGGFGHLWGQNVGEGGGFFCGTWINL